jgi:adenine phosphoribosyltransferase
VNEEDTIFAGRQAVLEHFRWIDGAADTWSMLRSAESLSLIVAGLAALVESERPDVIIGIESRGFVLAPAVALALDVGFAPVRKDGSLFPGPLVKRVSGPDYRGNRRTLSARQDLFSPGQRVVMVDDWIETGSQAIAAEALVAACGALLVSVAVIVDEASAVARAELPTIMGLVRASEL